MKFSSRETLPSLMILVVVFVAVYFYNGSRQTQIIMGFMQKMLSDFFISYVLLFG
jgi:hypothetical protein